VQALAGEDITIYVNYSQTRSFCYVDDLIESFVRLTASPKVVTGSINFGNPVELTMIELVEQVLKLTNSRSKLKHMPLSADYPKQRRPYISKARSVLS
jgi:UDP-glucuronate decarboxylase